MLKAMSYVVKGISRDIQVFEEYYKREDAEDRRQGLMASDPFAELKIRVMRRESNVSPKAPRRPRTRIKSQVKTDNFRVVAFEKNELRVLRAAFHVLELRSKRNDTQGIQTHVSSERPLPEPPAPQNSERL
jgi:hypothetical protein